MPLSITGINIMASRSNNDSCLLVISLGNLEKKIIINQLLEILVVLVDIWEHKHMTIPLFQDAALA